MRLVSPHAKRKAYVTNVPGHIFVDRLDLLQIVLRAAHHFIRFRFHSGGRNTSVALQSGVPRRDFAPIRKRSDVQSPSFSLSRSLKKSVNAESSRRLLFLFPLPIPTPPPQNLPLPPLPHLPL